MSSTCHQSQRFLSTDRELQNISSTEHKHLQWSPHLVVYQITSVQFSCSVVSDSYNPMDCSTPGVLVLHHLPELAQTHVCQVGDTIQLSHPLLSLFLPHSVFPSIRVFANESALLITWPKYQNFNFNISPSSKHSGLIVGWTGWISLQSKGLSSVFSNTTVQQHQFFGARISLQSNSHIHT